MGIHADLASCLEALPIAYAKHRMLSDSRNQPRDFEIIQVNRTFEQVSGLPRSSIIGMKLKKLFQDMQEESQKVLELLTASAVAGSYASFEQFIASQQSWYEIHAYSDEPGYVHNPAL